VIRAAAQEKRCSASSSTPRSRVPQCAAKHKGDRSWLNKVLAMYGQDYPFHIRIKWYGQGAGGMREPARTSGDAKVASCRSGLLVQDSIYPPEKRRRSAKGQKTAAPLAQLPTA